MKFFAVLLCTLALAYGVLGQYSVGYGGIGGAAVGYGAAASESVTESVSSSSVSSASGVAAGGYGYGYGYGGGVAGASYGSSVSAASSTSITTKYNYAETWTHLYQVPFFQGICNLASAATTLEITQSLITQDFDFQSTFSTLWAQNPHLYNYIHGVVGFRATTIQERRFFYSVISQTPGYILRSLQIFSSHPFIFNSPFARFIMTGTSLELIQSWYSYRYLYTYSAFTSSTFISYLVQSRSYQSLLCGYFGISIEQYSETAILQLIFNAYQINPAGTLLCLRHILFRRSPLTYRQYLGISITSYRSRLSFWSRRAYFRSNPYLSYWNNYISSSSSSLSYSSRTASSAAYGATGGYYGSGGYYGAGGAYGESVQSSQVVTAQSSQSSSVAGVSSGGLLY
ncbi:uncharacterized protein LOC142325544 isoform X2 [Lycorma delicatula]|uniref:uncharacterized protein LOC142325544 isoform X2 n=1 Tax=Lycorma delicatula TaxID=130591 RepID=UPI003F513ED4